MKKLLTISVITFIFVVISYERDACAQDYYESLIKRVVDDVIEKGAADPDCACPHECYKFLYKMESKEDNFVELVEVKIKQKKKEKKKHWKKSKKGEVGEDETVLIINALYREEKVEKLDKTEVGKVVVETTVYLLDKNGDGIIDEMSYRQSKDDGEVLLEVGYKDGEIKGESVKQGLLKEWMLKDIQNYYEGYLERVGKLLDV